MVLGGSQPRSYQTPISRDIRNLPEYQNNLKSNQNSYNNRNNGYNNNGNQNSGDFPKLFHHKFKQQKFNPWDPDNWKDKEKSYNMVNKVKID